MMSARLCLDWYLTHYEATVAQMSAAIENVPGCRFALASGPGFVLGAGHVHASLILGRE